MSEGPSSVYYCLEKSKTLSEIQLTRPKLESVLGPCNGITRRQTDVLGLSWPPKKGWKKKITGSYISGYQWSELVDAREQRKAETAGKKPKQKKKHSDDLLNFVEIDYKMTWEEQYKHPNWQRVRLYVMRRDGFRCIRCRNNQRQLHIHHTQYDRDGFIWTVPTSTLETLCDLCHDREHGR